MLLLSNNTKKNSLGTNYNKTCFDIHQKLEWLVTVILNSISTKPKCIKCWWISISGAYLEMLDFFSSLAVFSNKKVVYSVRSNLAMHPSDTPFAIRQPIRRPHLLGRVYKPIRTPHWDGVLPLRALEIGY